MTAKRKEDEKKWREKDLAAAGQSGGSDTETGAVPKAKAKSKAKGQPKIKAAT